MKTPALKLRPRRSGFDQKKNTGGGSQVALNPPTSGQRERKATPSRSRFNAAPMLSAVIVRVVVLAFTPSRTPPRQTVSGYTGGYICPASGLDIARFETAEAFDAPAPKLLILCVLSVFSPLPFERCGPIV